MIKFKKINKKLFKKPLTDFQDAKSKLISDTLLNLNLIQPGNWEVTLSEPGYIDFSLKFTSGWDNVVICYSISTNYQEDEEDGVGEIFELFVNDEDIFQSGIDDFNEKCSLYYLENFK